MAYIYIRLFGHGAYLIFFPGSFEILLPIMFRGYYICFYKQNRNGQNSQSPLSFIEVLWVFIAYFAQCLV